MNVFLNSGGFWRSNVLLLLYLFHATTITNSAVDQYIQNTPLSDNYVSTNFNLSERFQYFVPFDTDADYSVTVCADIPDNTNPDRVHIGKQPGHVFLILKKARKTGSNICQVFGFYPQREYSSLIAGDVNSKLLDNSKREYNASISARVSSKEFQMILQKSRQLANRRYNLHKFNCYDYVLQVFNSIPNIKKLPITHTRLPLFFGRAGSPCGLYKDLKFLKTTGSELAPHIRFGIFKAPESFSVEHIDNSPSISVRIN
jgi:hypothetical protein